ncbi:unnamed protein product [Moneuplotes crassus]|uniref:Uncharacterized protein n=1 Tax=Euplotes crassus TaxID=5936 RepID=A0AAD1Y497_EUPCR|nr:unnamed protein product [Moneuplotes crassus]
MGVIYRSCVLLSGLGLIKNHCKNSSGFNFDSQTHIFSENNWEASEKPSINNLEFDQTFHEIVADTIEIQSKSNKKTFGKLRNKYIREKAYNQAKACKQAVCKSRTSMAKQRSKFKKKKIFKHELSFNIRKLQGSSNISDLIKERVQLDDLGFMRAQRNLNMTQITNGSIKNKDAQISPMRNEASSPKESSFINIPAQKRATSMNKVDEYRILDHVSLFPHSESPDQKNLYKMISQSPQKLLKLVKMKAKDRLESTDMKIVGENIAEVIKNTFMTKVLTTAPESAEKRRMSQDSKVDQDLTMHAQEVPVDSKKMIRHKSLLYPIKLSHIKGWKKIIGKKGYKKGLEFNDPIEIINNHRASDSYDTQNIMFFSNKNSLRPKTKLKSPYKGRNMPSLYDTNSKTDSTELHPSDGINYSEVANPMKVFCMKSKNDNKTDDIVNLSSKCSVRSKPNTNNLNHKESERSKKAAIVVQSRIGRAKNSCQSSSKTGLFASISKSFTDAIRRRSPQKSAEFQTMSKFYPEKRGNRVACKLENKSRAQTQEGRTRKKIHSNSRQHWKHLHPKNQVPSPPAFKISSYNYNPKFPNNDYNSRPKTTIGGSKNAFRNSKMLQKRHQGPSKSIHEEDRDQSLSYGDHNIPNSYHKANHMYSKYSKLVKGSCWRGRRNGYKVGISG